MCIPTPMWSHCLFSVNLHGLKSWYQSEASHWHFRKHCFCLEIQSLSRATSVPPPPLWAVPLSLGLLRRCDWPVSYLVILSGGFRRSVCGEQLLWCQWRPTGLWGELFVHPESRLWALYLWRRRRRQHWQVGVPDGDTFFLGALETGIINLNV